jgi:ribose transport system substrate-binding protein
MNRLMRVAAVGLGGVLGVFVGASVLGLGEPAPSPGPKLVIGVVAKSTSNPVFIAARTGAEDACRDLSKKYGIEIVSKWQTPVTEDAQKQGQYVEQLVSQGVDGIAISCTSADELLKPINAAVDRGVTVVTFDSDCPKSKRMAYYGINDVACGKAVMQQLAKAMGDKGGVVAILSGSQTAPNLNGRIQGVKDELETLKSKGFTLKQVFYTKETAAEAAAMVQQVQNANPDIAGWAMVGGWPLFTKNALDNVSAKVVSVDTLAPQLEYVKSGKVQALIGQDCYGWGYQSVVMIVEKLKDSKTPKEINNFELAVVTKDNVKEYEGLWEKWLGGNKGKDDSKKDEPKKEEKK